VTLTSSTSRPSAPESAEEILPGYHVDRETGAWLTLPPFPVGEIPTIGYYVIRWVEEWLHNHITGDPWVYRPSQVNLILWWFALAGPGPVPRWLFRSGVRRGAKGTGKDPLMGTLAAAELCGPTLPVWERDRWVGRTHPFSLVQLGANSEGQAKDVIMVMNAMLDADMVAAYGIDKGITRTQLPSGSRVEVLTTSERSGEGDPATAIFLNETHHMTVTSGGDRLAAVARRNAGKGPGWSRAGARVHEHPPAGRGLDGRAVLRGVAVAGEGPDEADRHPLRQLRGAAGRAARGRGRPDARAARGVPRFALVRSRAARRRGDGSADADRRLDPVLPRQPADGSDRVGGSPQVRRPRPARHRGPDGEAIALFLDCSKSGDATTLAGARMSDGHAIAFGAWQKPHGLQGQGWMAPREEVDARVREVQARFDVWWFGVDPSPAEDDTTEASYWGPTIDGFHRDFRDERTGVLLWATPGRNAVLFDMRLSQPGARDRLREFTAECERAAQSIEDGTGPTWDGNPILRSHVHNARRRPNQWGVSIGKKSRSSSLLVDYAVTMIGAQLGRRLVLNSGKSRRKRTGRASF
jgi:hypothetical protein